MNGPRLINFKRFSEASGELVPFYVNKSFPKKFRLIRFFFYMEKRNILELIMHTRNVHKL